MSRKSKKKARVEKNFQKRLNCYLSMDAMRAMDIVNACTKKDNGISFEKIVYEFAYRCQPLRI